MASLPGPAARAAGRVCCVNGKCHKAHHLRMMKSTAPRESRRLLAELGACARLDREDLIRATVTLSRRTQLALATQCLDAMGHRHMRPSLVAHNALLEANARQRRWDYGLKLLLRMQQHGLQPNEVSYTSVIRASVGTPGSAQLVEMLLPQLLEARRRDLGVEPNARRGEGGSEGAGELGVGARAHEHKPPSAVASAAASAIWAGEPMTIGDLSPRAQAALLEARSSDAELLHSGEEGSEAPGLHLLQQQLADGAPTDAASFAHALSGCAKQPGRWREALQLTSMLESWVRMADGGRRARAQDRDVSRAFTLAISACDASGRAQPALDMLRRMDELGVPPAERHFSAAISACRHVETGGGLGAARELFDAMRRERVARTTYTYNAMLSVMAAEGGHGSEALELLARMQSEGGREAPPDGVTYLNVMMACRPTREQSAALRQAAYRRRRSEFGAERPPPQLTTPSPSASRDDVPGRGEEGATALSGGDAVAVAEPRAGAGEPIGGGVAADRQLALTDADEPPWRVAMRLLGEMGLRGIPPTVFTYGALMELCYRTSDLDGAMRLLREMPKRGLVPDGAVLGSAMRVVAAFGEQRIAISLLTEVEEEVRRLRLLDSTDTEPLPAGSSARRARTIGLFDARPGVDAAESGTKCSLSSIRERLTAAGVDVSALWGRIVDVVLRSLYAVHDCMAHQPNCFELYGYDILIDDRLKPWLIEVNSSPSLARDHPLDATIKEGLVADTLSLVAPMHFDRAVWAEMVRWRLNGVRGGSPAFSAELCALLHGAQPRAHGEFPPSDAQGLYQRIAPSPAWDRLGGKRDVRR